MDPKTVTVGLGIGVIGAAFLAYYGFKNYNEFPANVATEKNTASIQERSAWVERHKENTTDTPEATSIEMEVIKQPTRVAAMKITQKTNIKINATELKREVKGAVQNWGQFWKEEYEKQRIQAEAGK